MALNGSYQGSIRGYTVRTIWSAEQNTSGNYSDLTVTMYLDISSGYTLYIGSRTHTITIDGTDYNITSSSINGSGSFRLGTIEKRIYHNADGTKNITLSSVFSMQATINGGYVNTISGSSGTFTLDKIPRMSVVSDTMDGSRYLGTSHTLRIISSLPNVTHTVWYRIRGEMGNSNWYKIGDNITNTATFTPTTQHIDLQPNNSTIYMDIKCQTFRNGVQVGEDSFNNGWYMKVPENITPNITSSSITDINTKSSRLNVYIQHHSKLRIVVNASGIYGSTIRETRVEVDGKSYFGTTIQTDTIRQRGNVSVKITVTDSRGKQKSTTRYLNFYEYQIPTITTFDGNRSNGRGVLTEDGRYVKIERNFSASSINGRNTISWKIEKRPHESTSWTTLETGTTSSVTTSKEYSNISQDYAYEIRLTITDFYTSVSKSFNIFTSISLIDFHSSGRGLAVGKSAEKENYFEVDFLTDFRKDIEVRQEAEFKKIPKINGTPIIRKPQTLALQNNWSRYNASEPMRVIKDFNGVVHLQGIIKGGTTDWGTTLFTLPEIYRPKKLIYGKIFLEDYSIGGIRIETDGRVRLSHGNKEMWKKWACFDGVSFFID